VLSAFQINKILRPDDLKTDILNKIDSKKINNQKKNKSNIELKLKFPLFLILVLCFGAAFISYADIFSPGELSWHHEKWDVLDSCNVCHSSDKGVSPKLCLDCHTGLKTRIDNGLGYHKDKKDNCIECHSGYK